MIIEIMHIVDIKNMLLLCSVLDFQHLNTSLTLERLEVFLP